MPVMSQVVEDVEVYTGKAKTGKPFTKYTLIMKGGVKYACNFDKPGCAAGDTISFQTNPPNSFSGGAEIAIVKTINVEAKGMGKPKPPVVAVNKPSGFNTVFPVPGDHDRTATLRQNALDNAVKFCSTNAMLSKKQVDKDHVIEMAYIFTQFTSGQLDATLVKEATEAAMKDEVG